MNRKQAFESLVRAYEAAGLDTEILYQYATEVGLLVDDPGWEVAALILLSMRPLTAAIERQAIFLRRGLAWLRRALKIAAAERKEANVERNKQMRIAEDLWSTVHRISRMMPTLEAAASIAQKSYHREDRNQAELAEIAKGLRSWFSLVWWTFVSGVGLLILLVSVNLIREMTR